MANRDATRKPNPVDADAGEWLRVTRTVPNVGPRSRHRYPEVPAGTVGAYVSDRVMKGVPVVALRVPADGQHTEHSVTVDMSAVQECDHASADQDVQEKGKAWRRANRDLASRLVAADKSPYVSEPLQGHLMAIKAGYGLSEVATSSLRRLLEDWEERQRRAEVSEHVGSVGEAITGVFWVEAVSYPAHHPFRLIKVRDADQNLCVWVEHGGSPGRVFFGYKVTLTAEIGEHQRSHTTGERATILKHVELVETQAVRRKP